VTSELDIMEIFITRPDGQERGALVGFGNDGTLWIQPEELDIDPEQAAARVKLPEPFMVMAPANGMVFIRADAATELIQSPWQRGLWRQMVKKLLKAYQGIRLYESARNN
jgi:hypothetical protein